ncbi:hypothetical protein ACFS4T_16515 [Pseudomonas lini]
MIEQVDAAELSPGEFSYRVRRCVDEGNIKNRGDRQYQRLSGGNARRKMPWCCTCMSCCCTSIAKAPRRS